MSLRDWLSQGGGPGVEGRAPGHRASPFHRLRVIYGVPDASRGLFFDSCHQPLHLMTLLLSPVSSRDWLSRGGVLAAKAARPATMRRHFIASERSTAFQTRLVSCLLISAIRSFIR